MIRTCNQFLSCAKWLLLAATLSLGACASHPPAPLSAATTDYSYKIGPGDTLNIVVWRNPELSMSVPVRPDGKISAPLIDDLAAMGKDSTALARDIEKELAKFIRDPVVTVIVTGFVGPYSEQIRVVGEAADVWFHMLVAMSRYDVGGADVLAELARREGLSGIEEKASRPK